MYFDTHAHYDDAAFDEDRYELFEAMYRDGVDLIVNPGCEVKSSEMALSFARRYPFVYAAVGYHPEELKSFDEAGFEKIKKLATHERCVAIGEIGLDYYWDDSRKDEQKILFRRQIELALELCKPIIVHDREAHADSMEIVCSYPELKGVFHCYSGSAEMAKELIKLGWMISFTGVLTYKNARKAVEAAEAVPIESVMIETDAPYMAPVPHRGERCDSSLVLHTCGRLAEIKGISAEDCARITMENGKRFFGIK